MLIAMGNQEFIETAGNIAEYYAEEIFGFPRGGCTDYDSLHVLA
jgi:hypothetical protein